LHILHCFAVEKHLSAVFTPKNVQDGNIAQNISTVNGDILYVTIIWNARKWFCTLKLLGIRKSRLQILTSESNGEMSAFNVATGRWNLRTGKRNLLLPISEKLAQLKALLKANQRTRIEFNHF
jgi:hypothetical protein